MGLFAVIDRALEKKQNIGLSGTRIQSKCSETPPQDISSTQSEHKSEYTDLWYQACELEDYTSSDAPYPERAARVPELTYLVEKMRVIENKTKAKLSTRSVKKIPGTPEDYFQAPAVWSPSATDQRDHRGTCPACGQRQWWRKKEPGAKWICGRCHPPAAGLDVIFRDE